MSLEFFVVEVTDLVALSDFTHSGRIDGELKSCIRSFVVSTPFASAFHNLERRKPPIMFVGDTNL